jgi:hypothetical protein
MINNPITIIKQLQLPDYASPLLEKANYAKNESKDER